MKRTLLVLSAASLIVAVVASWWFHRRELDAIVGTIIEVAPTVIPARTLADISGEIDPSHARALASRALLASAFDVEGLAELGPSRQAEELAERASALEIAETMAFAALQERQSHWQAALVLGGARYLHNSITLDRALFTEHRRWEAPLEAARSMAPSQPEPSRFLSMAYLEVWPVLSPEKRDASRRMLATSFEDRQTFERTIRPWLEVNHDLSEALELMPDEPYAWAEVFRVLSQSKDWHILALVHDRSLDSMWRRSVARLADSATLRESDPRLARIELMTVLGLPPSHRFRELVQQAMQALPAGPVDLATAHSLTRWTQWEIDRCLYLACAFPEDVDRRMANAAFDLEPLHEARAALAYNDLAGAQQIAEQAGATAFDASWAPYHLQLAKRLIERAQATEALAALSHVRGPMERGALYLQVRSQAEELLGDRSAAIALRTELNLRAANSFPASGWFEVTNSGHEKLMKRMELLTAVEASVLEIEWTGVPGEGCAVTFSVDGRQLAARALSSSRASRLELPRSLAPGLHLLEIYRVAGQPPTPGVVSLIAE